jgi:hypothetical protein
VSTWSRRVAAALRNTRIRQGIAQLAVAWMENHINENRGQPRQGAVGASGAGPDGIAHRPLVLGTGAATRCRDARIANDLGEGAEPDDLRAALGRVLRVHLQHGFGFDVAQALHVHKS